MVVEAVLACKGRSFVYDSCRKGIGFLRGMEYNFARWRMELNMMCVCRRYQSIFLLCVRLREVMRVAGEFLGCRG